MGSVAFELELMATWSAKMALTLRARKPATAAGRASFRRPPLSPNPWSLFS